PPPGASFPLPDMDSCMPSPTPAGIFTVIISSFDTSPELSTPGGRLSITCPDPSQVGQVLADTIWPNMVFTTRFIWPLPWHVVQVLKDTPSARTSLFTFIFF